MIDWIDFQRCAPGRCGHSDGVFDRAVQRRIQIESADIPGRARSRVVDLVRTVDYLGWGVPFQYRRLQVRSSNWSLDSILAVGYAIPARNETLRCEA